MEHVIITEVLSANSGDHEATSNQLRAIVGTNRLPPLKDCVICLCEPREVRFNCGHACCCSACTAHLQAMGDPRCPNCRAPITFSIAGGNAEGVPIARQPTFEPQPHRQASAGSPSGPRSQVRNMHVHLFECCQGCIPRWTWYAAHRLWQRVLVPLAVLGVFLFLVTRGGHGNPTSEGSPPTPPPAPAAPQGCRLSDCGEWRRYPTWRLSLIDALATLVGASGACVWHGIRLRNGQRPLPMVRHVVAFVATTGAMGFLAGSLLLPAVSLLVGIGVRLAHWILAGSPALLIGVLCYMEGWRARSSTALERLTHHFLTVVALSFAFAVGASSMAVSLLESVLSSFTSPLVVGCCVFLGWQLMLSEARSAPDRLVTQSVRYGYTDESG